MPSDERMDQALKALDDQRNAFRSALGTTVDQIDHYLAEQGTGENGGAHRVAGELGPFAANRIDVDRFSQLFQTATLDGRVLETIEQTRDTMTELVAQQDKLFQVDVKSGSDVTAVVARALEEIGRAFGAARVFDLARSGGYKDRRHARTLGAFPFAQWTGREREMAPPLVVTIDGSDLRPAGLAEFMDGSVQLVLIVRGDAPPAPLVRLITPGTFVLQTHDGTGLERLAAWSGPGVAAWMPESAARFVHDPTADGLTIDYVPEETPKHSVGGSSAAQQMEELRQLESLASTAASVTAPAAPAAPAGVAPADKLAAWLLSQVDLENVG